MMKVNALKTSVAISIVIMVSLIYGCKSTPTRGGDSQMSPYMVIDLSAGPAASNYPVSYLSDIPAGGWTDEYKTTKMVLRLMPAGIFIMGSPTNELGRYIGENQHEVTLTHPFYMGVFETTQKQWERIAGNWPSFCNTINFRDACPVERVSYIDIRGEGAGTNWPATDIVDANSFMGRLRVRTGKAFDLPTEAQWEYAGRARSTTSLNSGKNLTSTGECPNMSQLGRYLYNGGQVYGHEVAPSNTTVKVGSYLPNQWGLYDIHGNVWEKCLDWYGGYPGFVTDPKGASSGSSRVFRGGSWCGSGADNCRVAKRGFLSGHFYSDEMSASDTGFRIVVCAGKSGELPVSNSIVGGVEYGNQVIDDFASFAWTNTLFAPVPRNEVESTSASVSPVRRFHRLAETNLSQLVRPYLVIDLSNGPSATSYPISYLTNVPVGGWADEYKTTKMVFRYIPAGTFLMGLPEKDRWLGLGSEPVIQHEVTLTHPFYIGVFEVTQEQWERVMGNWPSYFTNYSCRNTRPVEQVAYSAIRGASSGANWPATNSVDTDSFMGRLRARTGNTFDLPTESQWEYVGQVGTTMLMNACSDLIVQYRLPDVSKMGRHKGNGYGKHPSSSVDTSEGTAKVGSYLPNQWGVHDMLGNVSEWCLDWEGGYPGTVIDPKGALVSPNRIRRGGSWVDGAEYCRGDIRFGMPPNSSYFHIGFRVVMGTR